MSRDDGSDSRGGENCVEFFCILFQDKHQLIMPTRNIKYVECISKQSYTKENVFLKMRPYSDKLDIEKGCEVAKPYLHGNYDLHAGKLTIIYEASQAKGKIPASVSGLFA